MGRVRLVASLVGVAALVALLAPASALAGTYSWSQPGDFSGSNPEHKYGQPSWSYDQGSGTNLTPLSCNASTCSGGGDSVSVSSGKLVMQAAAGGAVTLVWTSPFTSNQSVTVTSSFTVSGLLCNAPTLSVPNGSPTTVAPGSKVTLTLSGAVVNSCQASGTISISAVSTAPSVTLTSPSPGQTFTSSQPTFSGGASSGFGISNQVTVNVYNGSSASGTPVESLPTTVSGGSYSVALFANLGNGQYTAQAEQDDLAGDVGLSSPVTFMVNFPGPTVTLASLGGAPLTTLTPTFSGTAGTRSIDAGQVTVSVYAGTNVNASPVEQLATPVNADGTYSVQAQPALGNGQYTAVATQGSSVGTGNSSPMTFTIGVSPPTVSLASLGTTPVGNGTPTLSGTAGTRSIDTGQVAILIYAGGSVGNSPVRQLTAGIGANGAYSAQVTPALSDGQYTAIAMQGSSVGTGQSHAVTFQIKVTAPRLTLDQPAEGVTLNDRTPAFSGRAGDAVGDLPLVTVELYRGTSASGKALGSKRVSVRGSSWSTTWSHTLAYGRYTVVAVQSDEAGHTSRTPPQTFTVAPTPKLIGATAHLSRSGQASVTVGCLAGPGQTCTGTVLIVTRRSYRTTAAGPTGPLEVLFARVKITGGLTRTIHRFVSSPVLRVLLHKRRVPVVITVNLSGPAGGPIRARADRVLELRR